MGQFDRFVERTSTTPPVVVRVFSVVAPVLMVVQAVGTRRLEDILTAVFFVALLLPTGIAPKAYYARLATLDRRPVLGALLMFLIFGTGSFVLLAEFLGRSLSALIAVPVALILTVSSIRRRRR